MISTLKFILNHPLSRRRPLAALGRYAWWQTTSRLQETVEYDWVDGSKLVVRNGMTGATGNIYCGLHEFADMAFLLHFLRPEDLFVDVGANIGSYTVLASAVCGAYTISVEPDPDTIKHLRANVDVNQLSHRVELVEVALGSEEGVVHMTVGRDTINRVVSYSGPTTRITPVQRLDNVVAGRRPMLLKMDVEGYEEQVIAGASAVLEQPNLLAVISEGDTVEVRTFFNSHGFQRFAYEPFNRSLILDQGDAIPGQSNALFVRNIDAVKARVSQARRREIVGVEI